MQLAYKPSYATRVPTISEMPKVLTFNDNGLEPTCALRLENSDIRKKGVLKSNGEGVAVTILAKLAFSAAKVSLAGPEFGAGLFCTRNRTNDGLFFESSKFRVAARESLPSCYMLKASILCFASAVGTTAAYVGPVGELTDNDYSSNNWKNTTQHEIYRP